MKFSSSARRGLIIVQWVSLFSPSSSCFQRRLYDHFSEPNLLLDLNSYSNDLYDPGTNTDCKLSSTAEPLVARKCSHLINSDLGSYFGDSSLNQFTAPYGMWLLVGYFRSPTQIINNSSDFAIQLAIYVLCLTSATLASRGILEMII